MFAGSMFETADLVQGYLSVVYTSCWQEHTCKTEFFKMRPNHNCKGFCDPKCFYVTLNWVATYPPVEKYYLKHFQVDAFNAGMTL